MTPIDLVRLTALRDRTSGSPDVVVGLIDGPVAVDRPDLANENISPIPGKPDGACHRASSTACLHGTFVAGILSAKRATGAPAICPSCTLAKCRRSPAVAAAYEKNCRALFYALDELEKRLTTQRYRFGDPIVETSRRGAQRGSFLANVQLAFQVLDFSFVCVSEDVDRATHIAGVTHFQFLSNPMVSDQ